MRNIVVWTATLLSACLWTTTSAQAQLDLPLFTHDRAKHSRAMAATARVAATSDCLTLTESTTLTDDVPCLFVATGITVNLGGNTVFGSIVQLGVDADASNVTIRNGTVAGGSIVLFGTNILLDRLTVRDRALDFAVLIGGGVIKRSIFQRNGVAVDLFYGGGIDVRSSRFVDNEIAINIASDNHSLVRKNSFKGNQIGIRVFDEDRSGASGTTIRQNVFRRNDIGVFLDAQAEANDTTIQRNVFHANDSSGIAVRLSCDVFDTGKCGGLGTDIRHNTFRRNGSLPQMLVDTWTLSDEESLPYDATLDDGLTVIAFPKRGVAGAVTITRNVAFKNADLGIDAAGVSDGKRNRAARNGNAQQCRGVKCR